MLSGTRWGAVVRLSGILMKPEAEGKQRGADSPFVCGVCARTFAFGDRACYTATQASFNESSETEGCLREDVRTLWVRPRRANDPGPPSSLEAQHARHR